ncbi:MAG: hypothetical protein WCS37_15320 [Chloroflexota bacterium]
MASLNFVQTKCFGTADEHFYDLSFDETQNKYNLAKTKTVYTRFDSALDRITKPEVGEVSKFVDILQKKLDATKLTAPVAPVLIDEEEVELNDEELS